MARLLSVFTSRLTRRAYSTAAETVMGKEHTAMAVQPIAERASASEDEAARYWVPDPVTGYYRPANKTRAEIDPVDLREMLLSRSNGNSSSSSISH